MKIAIHLFRPTTLRTRTANQPRPRAPQAQRGTPAQRATQTPKDSPAPRGTPAQRRREHRLALARRDQAKGTDWGGWMGQTGDDEAIATLPRAPRRPLGLGRLWAYRIATGRTPGRRPRGPAFYL